MVGFNSFNNAIKNGDELTDEPRAHFSYGAHSWDILVSFLGEEVLSSSVRRHCTMFWSLNGLLAGVKASISENLGESFP